jgi:hypothetical protein
MKIKRYLLLGFILLGLVETSRYFSKTSSFRNPATGIAEPETHAVIQVIPATKSPEKTAQDSAQAELTDEELALAVEETITEVLGPPPVIDESELESEERLPLAQF